MITEKAPRFIVVDLTLPDSKAMQTLANIKKLRADSKDAVVIVITGYRTAGLDAARLAGLGVEVLNKPFLVPQLLRALGAVPVDEGSDRVSSPAKGE